MIYVGIDVTKDKHDCIISNADGEVLFNAFAVPNSREGFDVLFQKIQSVTYQSLQKNLSLRKAKRNKIINSLSF